jgi:hypothetical protein
MSISIIFILIAFAAFVIVPLALLIYLLAKGRKTNDE